MEFYLYDELKEMSLYDFCVVYKLPFEGSVEEPRPSDVDEFIDRIVVGETRKVSDARTTSIHFPVLCYFAIFAIRCLIGRGNSNPFGGTLGGHPPRFVQILCLDVQKRTKYGGMRT